MWQALIRATAPSSGQLLQQGFKCLINKVGATFASQTPLKSWNSYMTFPIFLWPFRLAASGTLKPSYTASLTIQRSISYSLRYIQLCNSPFKRRGKKGPGFLYFPHLAPLQDKKTCLQKQILGIFVWIKKKMCTNIIFPSSVIYASHFSSWLLFPLIFPLRWFNIMYADIQLMTANAFMHEKVVKISYLVQ